MNRYIQWYTANYRADLFLEPIPAATGDIGGFVYYDHLAPGTWIGNGIYDESDDRTMHGVPVELWDATGTTLIATTMTGQVDKAAVLAQGWMQPYTFPIDEWGGVFVGPLPGFYEFRDLAPGSYRVKVIPPGGFSPSPAGSDVITVTVTGGARVDQDFGINTPVPLAGEIEGGVWDDVFVDPRPLSLMYLEKAGIDGAPVGVYDHLGYFLGASYQGNPMCYLGADVGPDPMTQCPPGEPIPQKPETERRFAPAPLLYLGNDPALPGYNDEYLPLMMPYTMGQGKYKFEADWSLVPVALGDGPTQAGFPPVPPPSPPPVIANVQPGGGFLITGQNFGSRRWFSTVTLSGKELYVTSWSDIEIHVQLPTDPITGPMIVTTLAGSSNAVHVEIAYDPARATYMAERSVFVDASNTGPEDGSNAQPWNTIGEALDNLPTATPRYVFVAAGYYNERVHITESDIEIIGAGPQETTVDGLGSVQLSIEGQGFVGRGPVFFVGAGGEFGSVENIMISGLTVTRGTVDDDIGCGIFGDYGNRNLDINTCNLHHNGGYYGGAIWLHKSNHDVKIWSNTISNNGNPGGYSGGISVNDEPEYGPEHGQPEHIWDDHLPGCPPGTYEIFNNHILQNYSPDYGAAIALYEVKDHLIVAGNLIEANHAEDHGGAMFFEDSGPIDVFGNIIRRNSCYDDGGAISFEDVGDDIASVRVFNNLIAENWADDHGENHARGGGLAFDDTFYAEVFNNTIVGNVVAGSRDPAGGGIDSERNGHEYNGSEPLGYDIPPGYSDVKIYNNIIWGNMRLNYDQVQHSDEEDLDWRFGTNHVWSPDNLHVDNPSLQGEWESHNNSESFTHVEFNIIDNGEYADRLGNIGLDPLFVDSDNLDWHLAAGSPAVNQAPAISAPERDLDRAFRLISDGMVDMGAYELGALPGNEGLVSPLKSPVAVCDTGGPYVIECHGQTMTTVQLDGRVSNDPDPGRTLTYAWSTDCPDGTFDDDAGPTPVLTLTMGALCPLTCNVNLALSNCSDGWTVACSTTVTVADTAEPTLSGVPADVTVDCATVPSPASPTATDTCDAAPQITLSEMPTDGACPDTYTLTRTWTATDTCGNSSSQTQVITVQDTVAPVLTAPSDLTVECTDPTDPPATGLALATDNCDAAPAVTYTDVENLTACNGTGTITRTWTATDACGNATTLDQVITIVDTTAPALAVAADVTVECTEPTDPGNTGQSTATDNCDAAPAVTYTDVADLTGCNGTGSITRTWTATDACGNATALVQVITVLDTTAPSLTMPPDVTVECDQPTDPSNTGSTTAADNCDAVPDVTFGDDVAAGACPQQAVITRTWTGTDACNNSTTSSQIITVVDRTPPLIVCPSDLTITLADSSTDPADTGQATATDNCDAVPGITFSDAEAPPYAYCPTAWTIARTWSAIDQCSNEMSCDQLIDVTDPSSHPPGYCCNPNNGDLNLIDDGNECTNDICDPATGQVEHPDSGLCGACCVQGKACIYVLAETCETLGGAFLGEQTFCLGDGDGDGGDDQCDNCNGVDDSVFGFWICKPSGGLCETDADCPQGERCEKACIGEIPTVSGWGLLILVLLLMAGGKVCFGRRWRSAPC
ncbi:MAG: hypothetical protein ACE5HE_04885 [Phycisphaerae bacterium]